MDMKNLLNKLKEFLKKNKKLLEKLLILLIVVAAMSVISAVILNLCGVIYFVDGELKINETLTESFRSSVYGWLLIILLQVLVTGLLCFLPGASMTFITIIGNFFKNNLWFAFFVAFLGVMISSLIMYFIGRLGGYRICKKILGKEDSDKAADLLHHHGVVYFPLMMSFPIFPDDALVMIAGALKMPLKWFIPSILFGRSIGIATIIFGFVNILGMLTSPWHWVLFIAGCAIFIVGVFYLAHRLNVYLAKRSRRIAALHGEASLESAKGADGAEEAQSAEKATASQSSESADNSSL